MMEIITRQEAIEQGLKRFFTGEPCCNGHVCERYCSNGLCFECRRVVGAKHSEKKRQEENRHPLQHRILSFINAYKKCDHQPTWDQALRAVENRFSADRAGFSVYDPEYPCTHGHISNRRVKEGMCVKCQNDAGLARMRKKRKNPEYKKADNDRALRYYHNNKKVIAEKRKKDWRSGKIKDRQYEYYKKNKSKYCALTVHYQMKKKMHTLSCVSSREFISFYKKRDALTDKTGIPHEVDHYYPLQGENICGLHVPWNLQIIPASENRQKHNSMPEDFYGANHTPPIWEIN